MGTKVAAFLAVVLSGYYSTKMRFPRGTTLKLPVKRFSKSSFDAEKLSFFIVIAFFSIFAIIVFVELFFKDRDYE